MSSAGLSLGCYAGKLLSMPGLQPPRPAPTSRAERLAQQLRANLHRRKAQARAQSGTDAAGGATAQPALPKAPPDS
jgi:hypothetical protein